MAETAVDKLSREFSQIGEVLSRAEEVSLKVTADNIFRKVLLLSSASMFERQISEALLGISTDLCGNNELMNEFIRNKAIARQYHTYFDWERSNANKFYGLFGAGFLEYMKRYVDEHADYDEAVKAFLEIGQQRNMLTHGDLATASLEKTKEEIVELYARALLFVESLKDRFREYLELDDN